MGVPFIKNTYAAFDFGDETSQNANTPFVRMVATTTPEDAEKEFRKARPFQISVHRKLLEKSASRSGPKDGDTR
ncbi:hypothetical protein QCA50_003848 [Cerrena zonata]|uniref:Uncharacterized protein n=1 Tax=Cerrena zonata TaxID=2478898 RepID=A0AAW0GM60_9APHY